MFLSHDHGLAALPKLWVILLSNLFWLINLSTFKVLISKDFQFANVPVIKYLLSVHQKIILNIKEAIKNSQRQNLQKALRKDLDNK